MLLLITQQINWFCSDFTQQLRQAQVSERVANLLVHDFQVFLLLKLLLLRECFLEEFDVEIVFIGGLIWFWVVSVFVF